MSYPVVSEIKCPNQQFLGSNIILLPEFHEAHTKCLLANKRSLRYHFNNTRGVSLFIFFFFFFFFFCFFFFFNCPISATLPEAGVI